MGLTNIRLGDYIERSTINNKDLKYGVDLIVGVNSQGVFATPKQRNMYLYQQKNYSRKEIKVFRKFLSKPIF